MNENKDEKNIILNEDERNLLLDHNYDGIEEFDYPLPYWWTVTFYGGIVFGAIYIMYYLVIGGASNIDEFNSEWKVVSAIRSSEAANISNFNVEEYRAYISNPTVDGEVVFVDNCVACHKEKGIGDIGPNLTDKYWIHISDKVEPATVYPIVVTGVEDNGMPAWGEVLSREEIYAVVDYVMSLKNKNLEGKEPQGEVVEE